MKNKEEVRIVVLQGGWIYVGILDSKYLYDARFEYSLSRASCIRRWGTLNGLGELRDGPLPNTVLDFAGIVHFHAHALVYTINVNSEAWLKKL